MADTQVFWAGRCRWQTQPDMPLAFIQGDYGRKIESVMLLGNIKWNVEGGMQNAENRSKPLMDTNLGNFKRKESREEREESQRDNCWGQVDIGHCW